MNNFRVVITDAKTGEVLHNKMCDMVIGALKDERGIFHVSCCTGKFGEILECADGAKKAAIGTVKELVPQSSGRYLLQALSWLCENA